MRRRKAEETNQRGFTMIELVMVIVLLGTLSVIVTVKWPSGMKERVAVLEFKRAVRHAQHYAMTREYTGVASVWGISVSGNTYTIKRYDGPDVEGGTLSVEGITGKTGVWFNGLGEPFIDDAGNPVTDTDYTFTIGDNGKITVCPETGYVLEGISCP